MSPLFYLLAAMTIGGAVASMSLRNPVHCALCLVVTFVGLAGVYLAMGAQFLGLVQVLVYVGAVAILLVFVLLLTRSSEVQAGPMGTAGWRMGLFVGGLTIAILVTVVLAPPQLPIRQAPPELPGVRDIGVSLMTDFILPLQVIGVLLTAAMIGAAIIALQEKKPASRPRPRSLR